jgi:hypothetical protein
LRLGYKLFIEMGARVCVDIRASVCTIYVCTYGLIKRINKIKFHLCAVIEFKILRYLLLIFLAVFLLFNIFEIVVTITLFISNHLILLG